MLPLSFTLEEYGLTRVLFELWNPGFRVRSITQLAELIHRQLTQPVHSFLSILRAVLVGK